MKGNCRLCGSDILQCRCPSLPKNLRLVDVQEVLLFLRSSVGFEKELSTFAVMRSLCLETVMTASSPDWYRRGYYLPTFSAHTLMPILERLVGDRARADALLRACRRSYDLRTELEMLQAENLGAILALYHRRYLSETVRPPDYVAAGFGCPRVQDDVTLTAMLTPVVFGTDDTISAMGHSKLSTSPRGRRYCKAIFVTANLPRPIAAMVLCHELVHFALWIREPIRPGYEPLEEVLCHAVVDCFATQLTEKEGCSASELRAVEHTRAVCLNAARRMDAIVLKELTTLANSRVGAADAMVRTLDRALQRSSATRFGFTRRF